MEESTIILTVEHAEHCKLIALLSNTSWLDVYSQICEKWNELQRVDFDFLCSVGSLLNVSCVSDADLHNIINLCQIRSLKEVSGKVYVNDLSFAKKIHNSDQIVSSVMNTTTICLNSQHGKEVQHNMIGWQSEEFREISNMPYYDICPSLDKKVFLSDPWAILMKDGKGALFHGGAKEFRDQLIKYATRNDFFFLYKRNDAKYVHAICERSMTHGCEWFIKAKRLSISSQFQVYAVNLVHTCDGVLGDNIIKRLCPKMIGNLMLESVREKPDIGGSNVKHVFLHSYGIKIPYWKAWRAAEEAKDQVWGSYDQSYDELRLYCAAVSATNPGSIVTLEQNPMSHRFERLFIAFKGCIDGFKSCRPMLFIDGTFLKGRSKGTLLAATAKDGDNGLFPVAIAVVSAENTENWEWFLREIRDNVMHDEPISYISDRNVGLMSAFSLVFDQPLHFFCLFHLLTNLKARFPKAWNSSDRPNMGVLFKACAYAPTKRLFDENLAKFKQEGGKRAEQWLTNLPYEKWAVAFSPKITRYGEMTSNAIESFNAWINNARALPITHMLDSIRKGINSWFVERRMESSKWTGGLCPTKEVVWQDLIYLGRTWNILLCTSGDYEVASQPSVRVDLKCRTCSCKLWQISGFPCAHAVAVIRATNGSYFNYISDYFFVTKYRESYMHDIHPIPETYRLEVEPIFDNPILPPLLKRPPGRPKMSRIPSHGEFCKRRKAG